MIGTITRNIGREMHTKLKIETAIEELTTGARVDVQPDPAAIELARQNLLMVPRQTLKQALQAGTISVVEAGALGLFSNAADTAAKTD